MKKLTGWLPDDNSDEYLKKFKISLIAVSAISLALSYVAYSSTQITWSYELDMMGELTISHDVRQF